MRSFVGNEKEWSSMMRMNDEEVNEIRKTKSFIYVSITKIKSQLQIKSLNLFYNGPKFRLQCVYVHTN